MQDETFTLLEDTIQKQLLEIKGMDESQETERSKLTQDTVKLIEKMTEAETASAKWYDDQQRREIEKERNKSSIELEYHKQQMDWKRMALEIGKITVPTILPLLIWRKSFKEMLKFEETGRFTTSASRELRLPKIFNNK